MRVSIRSRQLATQTAIQGVAVVCTHLQRRGNRYFLRRIIPVDLQAIYGKREITKALGTSDRRAAAVLCRRMGLELDDEFRLARAQKPVHFVQAVQQAAQPLQPVIAPVPLPIHPPDTKTPPGAPVRAADAVTLKDLADQWEMERKPDWKSIAATQRAVRRFTEMVGDILPRAIVRTHAVRFKDKLLESGQTSVTTNKHLTVLNVLLNYGAANGVLEYNPAQGVKVKVKQSAKDARHPFTLNDLQTIFDTLPAYKTRLTGYPCLPSSTGQGGKKSASLRPRMFSRKPM